MLRPKDWFYEAFFFLGIRRAAHVRTRMAMKMSSYVAIERILGQKSVGAGYQHVVLSISATLKRAHTLKLMTRRRALPEGGR